MKICFALALVLTEACQPVLRGKYNGEQAVTLGDPEGDTPETNTSSRESWQFQDALGNQVTITIEKPAGATTSYYVDSEPTPPLCPPGTHAPSCLAKGQTVDHWKIKSVIEKVRVTGNKPAEIRFCRRAYQLNDGYRPDSSQAVNSAPALVDLSQSFYSDLLLVGNDTKGPCASGPLAEETRLDIYRVGNALALNGARLEIRDIAIDYAVPLVFPITFHNFSRRPYGNVETRMRLAPPADLRYYDRDWESVPPFYTVFGFDLSTKKYTPLPGTAWGRNRCAANDPTQVDCWEKVGGDFSYRPGPESLNRDLASYYSSYAGISSKFLATVRGAGIAVKVVRFKGKASEDIRFVRVKVYQSPHTAFSISQGNKNILLKSCKVALRQPGQLMTSLADGLMTNAGLRGLVVSGSTFEHQGDDGINIHSDFYPVLAVDRIRRTVQFEIKSGSAQLNVDGQANFVTNELRGVGVAAFGSVRYFTESTGERVGELVDVEENAPWNSLAPGQYLYLLENVPKNFLVENSVFRNNRSRALSLMGRNGMFRGNRFENQTQSAIQLGAFMYKFEVGPAPSNIVLENNTFTGGMNSKEGPLLFGSEITKQVGQYSRCFYSPNSGVRNILVRGNAVSKTQGDALQAYNVLPVNTGGHFSVRIDGLTVRDYHLALPVAERWAPLLAPGSRGVELVGNGVTVPGAAATTNIKLVTDQRSANLSPIPCR